MEHGGVTKKERLQQARDMLAARTDMRGKPLGGYANNVAKIISEIARLESEIAQGLE